MHRRVEIQHGSFQGTEEASIVMDMKDIRKIVEMMKQYELSEFELQDEAFKIAIKRRGGDESNVVISGHGVGAPESRLVMHSPAALTSAVGATPAPEGEPAPPQDASETIKSPMVGTFYRSSAPDADPFVTVGSEVEEDTVVCVIEAMKVMNEIKAETRGVIKKILVENSSPVQFGQPLFVVNPA